MPRSTGNEGGGGTPPAGSGGSGGSGGTTSTNQQSIDYSLSLAFFGMPQSMITQINNDIAQMTSSGMAADDMYNIIVGEIRSGQIGGNFSNGQSWYQYTYGGIQYGISNGLLDSSDPERSYRDYVNAINQFYKEYFGRDATTAEILGYLQGGVSANTVGAQLKGQSFANAYASGDATTQGYSWNALMEAFGNVGSGGLTDQQKLAMGENMTGYTTTMGDQLTKQLNTAVARLQTIFRGTLATPADLQKGGAGLKAPSLSAQSANPDTGPI